MKPAFTRDDIWRSIGQPYFQRGQAYFDADRVNYVEIIRDSPEMFTFTSAVTGSRGRVYEQEVDILFIHDDVDVSGECSCPVGYNCKHVASACLQLIEDRHRATKGPTSACMAWLESLQDGRPGEHMPRQEFLVYVLEPGTRPDTLKARLVITHVKKDGALARGREVKFDSLAYAYHVPNYLTDTDRAIMRLLRATQHSSCDPHAFTGETGYLALEKIIGAGRGYWRDHRKSPLRAGDPRPLRLDWNAVDDHFVLKAAPSPEARLLKTVPLLYLDEQRQTVGPVETGDLPPDLTARILAAPPVPEDLARTFSLELMTRHPNLEIPPPIPIEVEEKRGVTPRPCLRLHGRKEGNDYIHYLRLQFDYDGLRLGPYPASEVSVLDTGETIIRLERDLASEQAAITMVQGLGFQSLPGAERHTDFLSPTAAHISESMTRWSRLLDYELPRLEESGWEITIDDSFLIRFDEIDTIEAEIGEQESGWFDLRFDLDIGGEKLPLLPLVAGILEHYRPDELPETFSLPLGGHHYARVKGEQLRPVIETLYELFDTDTPDTGASLRLSRFKAGCLNHLDGNDASHIAIRGSRKLRELARKLGDFQGIRHAAVPDNFAGRLRSYQQQGLDWLQFLREYEFNGILADDMGLGKTVQTLANLLLEKNAGRMDLPCLILAPTSLMGNWRREAEHFTPDLDVLVLHGPDRRDHFHRIGEHDLVITTYPLLLRDHETLLAHEYHYLILDEAQVIKNPKSRSSRLVREIRARHRLCLIGTPMENHLGELWSLFDFLLPGLLDDSQVFTRRYRTPIEKHGDLDMKHRLARRIAPFMLRRRKQEVEKDLPDKTEIIHSVSLGRKQAMLYESIRLSMEKKVRKSIASKGLARSHITILDALLKLRQTCCDPRLLSLRQAANVNESAKLELLMEMLPELLEEGRRILLFSQFTRMLGLIEQALKRQGITYSKLTGQTRKRDQAIDRFRHGEVDLFLISLKAGGVGLNLTEADTVIHYDPWWNPAVEAQATSRAHRIGQDRPVFVYKLVTEGTVEEKILAMQENKRLLAEGIYDRQGERPGPVFTEEDLKLLFEAP